MRQEFAMRQVKTSDLQGVALDWAVALCEEKEGRDNAAHFLRDHQIGFSTNYSGVWSQGGPIIEREQINLVWWGADCSASMNVGPTASRRIEGPTPLVAAMRCFVASKLGDVVSIPEEL